MKRIMVIEDDPDVTLLLKDLFECRKFEGHFFSAGEIALEKIESIMPDLVIMDIMMPGITGFEICQHIRNTQAISTIPLLAITGYDSHENRKKIFAAGIDDYLPKPFDLKILLRKIEHLCP